MPIIKINSFSFHSRTGTYKNTINKTLRSNAFII
uniref:Uncharacterized protein n=1 Tax=Anguilla anguilla TaxID=7936 RepID=A0A0E9PMW7_ANGAN